MMTTNTDKNKMQINVADAEERDSTFERRLYRKCDRHILPILCSLYLCVFLDRINIGNASIEGLGRDLNMQGSDFNIALMIFYIFYIPVGLVANLFMKRFSPRVWLSSMTFGCGVITVCEGVTQSWAGLVVCRLLLGALEAGFVPGCVYLISSYYPRFSLQWRVNLFFSAPLMAGAFGGLLAYAIGHMDGLGGYGAWRWIFIIEGIATCIVATAAMWLVPEWPENAKFLKPVELDFIVEQVSLEKRNQASTVSKTSVLNQCLRNTSLWCTALMYFCTIVTSSSLAYFAPTILAELGWKSTKAQYMSIPIWLSILAVCLLVSMLADWLQHRSSFIIGGSLVASAGYAIMLGSVPSATSIRYFAIYLISIGAVSAQPTVLTWQANNLKSTQERGIAVAIQFGIGNCGGILASNIFLKSQAPEFPLGYGVGLGFILLLGVTCVGLLCYLKTRSVAVDETNAASSTHPYEESKTATRPQNNAAAFKYVY